jgi:hypothetical protein
MIPKLEGGQLLTLLGSILMLISIVVIIQLEELILMVMPMEII